MCAKGIPWRKVKILADRRETLAVIRFSDRASINKVVFRADLQTLTRLSFRQIGNKVRIISCKYCAPRLGPGTVWGGRQNFHFLRLPGPKDLKDAEIGAEFVHIAPKRRTSTRLVK